MKSNLVAFIILSSLLFYGCSSEVTQTSKDSNIYGDTNTLSDVVTKDSTTDIINGEDITVSDSTETDIVDEEDDAGIEEDGTADIDHTKDIGEGEEDAVIEDVSADIDIADDGGSQESIKIMTVGDELNEEGTGVFYDGREIYITGISYNKDYSNSDIFVGVLNEKTLTKTFNYTEFDMSFGIEVLDNTIYIGGYAGASGSFSGMMSLFSPSLEPVKQHTYKNQDGSVHFLDFKRLDSSRFVLAGYVNTTDNEAAVFIVDTSGNVVNSKVLKKNQDQEFYAVDVTVGGDIVLAGIDIVDTTNWMDMYVVKLDKDLNVIWEKRIGSNEMDMAHTVKALPTGEIIVAGYTEKNRNKSGRDGYAVLLDKEGEIILEKVFEAEGDGEIKAVINDDSGNLLFVVIENIYDPFSSTGDLTLIKVAADGNFIDGEILIGDATASRIIKYNSGYLIIGTYYDPHSGQGYSDILLINVKSF